jgi:ketosteroid isomerase-like protein
LNEELLVMSEQNVERDRRLVETFNTRDVEAFIELCAPDIEVHSVFTTVGGTTYHGHDGVCKWHRDLKETWGEEIRIESEAFFDLGEHTLGFQVIHGRGLRSGVGVAMPCAHVARWRDGLCDYLKVYIHREDAHEDMGVTEETLEPFAP